MLFIKSLPKPSHITIAVALTFLILAMLPLSGHDTAHASVPKPDRQIDLGVGNDKPEGAWSNNNTIWVVSEDDDKLYAYSLATGARREDRDIELRDGNNHPQGIVSRDSIMFVSDWDDTKLYAYRLSDGQRLPNRDINLADANDAPRGITFMNENILVVDKDDKKVYVYRQSDGERQRNLEFDLADKNDHPWGMWTTTDTVWVADTNDDLVYAYEKRSFGQFYINGPLQSVPRRTLRLPLGNTDVRGIAGKIAGETMWIVDAEDKSIYAMYAKDFHVRSSDIEISDVDTPRGIWTDGTTMYVVEGGSSGNPALRAYDAGDGSRDSSKDITLNDSSLDPVSIWSDGTELWVIGSANGTLKVFDPESGEPISRDFPIILTDDIEDPIGVWSDGATMWIADSKDLKVYAYNFLNGLRDSDSDFDLDPDNEDPGQIWSDGRNLWVLDTRDKNAYAYDLATGNRNPDVEFRPSPANDELSGGIAGHRTLIWVVDTARNKLYAYRKVNAPPEFDSAFVNFDVHHSIAGGSLIGLPPEATDPDGDNLTYSVEGQDSGRFTVDSQTGALHTANHARFSEGEEVHVAITVKDGKRGLNHTDNRVDDTLIANIKVLRNADPVFTTVNGSTFTVNENITDADVIAQLGVEDLDADPLVYDLSLGPRNPFTITDGTISLQPGENLDYERKTTYDLTIRVSDNLDLDGNADTSWDDQIDVTIQVNNVAETGEITLSNSLPVVGEAVTGTLTEPDGVDFGNSRQINWQVGRNADPNATTWEAVVNRNRNTKLLEYTPVADDVGQYLRFRASYWDNHDSDNLQVTTFVTANAVLAEAPTNRAPSFNDGSETSRSVPEDATGGSNAGDPVAATDPESGSLTYGITGEEADYFQVDASTGQISVGASVELDFEDKDSYEFQMQVHDGKDTDGNPESEISWDSFINVTVRITNVEEPGNVATDSEAPKEGHALTARLDDPDGSVSNLVWRWQRADSNPSDNWTEIADATTATYTPVDADVGKFLRAVASYDDVLGTGRSAEYTVANAVLDRDANAPPQFYEGDSATRSLSEDATTATWVGAAVAANDPEGNFLAYSLATGPDSNQFLLDTTDGRLLVVDGAVLDYETRQSLEVVLRVSDLKDADHNFDRSVDDSITVTINLLNVDEEGLVDLSSTEPSEGQALTATLTDPDGSLSGITWQWARAPIDESGWTDITVATSSTYTPVSDDGGMFLRATATYTDGEGSGKSASKVSSDTVQTLAGVDTTLKSLRFNRVPFSLNGTTLEYTVSVPNSVSQVKVKTAAAADSGVTVAISPADSSDTKPGHQVNLSEGENEINITVSDDNGDASTAYVVTIDRRGSSETLAASCSSDLSAFRVSHCGTGDFADYRVELDGSYTIDWSDWASDHQGVNAYSISLEQFMHRTYHRRNGGASISRLDNKYETCESSDGVWSCQDPVGHVQHVDSSGEPTVTRTLSTNLKRTQWSSALETLGSTSGEQTLFRWNGDAETEPTTVTYAIKDVEVDRYTITPKSGGAAQDAHTVTIAGAASFDSQSGTQR